MGPASNRNSQSSSAVQPDDGEAVESRSLASPQGYAAFVEELPGANTQGATLEEARANLVEAVAMVLEANRELAEEELLGQEVIREQLALA
jgi:predicted RNase H-like HicB family nuclease